MRAYPFSVRRTWLDAVPLIIVFVMGALALSQVRGSVTIAEVHYNTFSQGEDDEFIVIRNDGPDVVDLSGWDITDNEDVSPLNGSLSPGGSMVLTRDLESVLEKEPDFFSRRFSCVLGPYLELRLANDGDEVVLREHDRVMDAFVYGDGTSGTGWLGPPSPSLYEGEIAVRSGRDTNTSSDWTTGRLHRLGQSDFVPGYFMAESITALVTPDCTDGPITDLIGSANESILVEAYEILSLAIADALSNASRLGVDVTVLLDGGPVGWNFWNVYEVEYRERYRSLEKVYTEKSLVDRMVSAGVDVRFHTGIDPRYVFIHSKCIVADDAVLVSSDNLVEGAFPNELRFTGTSVRGSRGWAVILRGGEISDHFRAVIEHDIEGYDVVRWGTPPYDPPPSYFELGRDPDEWVWTSPVQPVVIAPFHVNRSVPILPVLSPDSSSGWPIVAMIENATEFVYVELLDLNPNWSRMGGNAYLEALLDAAGRDVDVRVLLDPTWAREGGSFDNHEMSKALVEASESLPELECRLLSPHGLTMLHNKGVVTEKSVLVSSINWGFNSVFRNRETAVIIEDREIAGYYRNAFFQDWNRSVLDKVGVSISYDGNYAVRLAGVNGSHQVDVRIGDVHTFSDVIREDETRTVPLIRSSGPVTITIDGSTIHLTDSTTDVTARDRTDRKVDDGAVDLGIPAMAIVAMVVWYIIFRKLRG